MSAHHPQTHRYPPSAPHRGLSEISPRRPWKPTDRLPGIVDLNTFARVHRQRDDRLKTYIQAPHANYQTLPPGLWPELLTRNRSWLFAGNAEARIDFAQIISKQLRLFGIADETPHNWVTVAPAQYVFPIDRAHEFDHRSLIALVRQALGDVPAVGMIEAAHYQKWGPYGPSPHDWVSWHAHFCPWNRTRGQLQPFVGEMSTRYSNMFGRSAIWIETIKPHEVERKLLYAAKAQVKTYRVLRQPGEDIDTGTGVITPKNWQTKDWMRTGNHVRMVRVMAGRRLEDLVFGNAAGTQVARAIRYEAMRPFCRWATPINVSAEKAGRVVPYPEVETYHAIGVRLERELRRSVL